MVRNAAVFATAAAAVNPATAAAVIAAAAAAAVTGPAHLSQTAWDLSHPKCTCLPWHPNDTGGQPVQFHPCHHRAKVAAAVAAAAAVVVVVVAAAAAAVATCPCASRLSRTSLPDLNPHLLHQQVENRRRSKH